MDNLVIKQTTGAKVKKKTKASNRSQDAFIDVLNKKRIKCSSCGRELRLLTWNSKVDVLVCNTIYCSKYRNPISVEKAAIADPSTPIAVVIPGADLPPCPYKGKDGIRAFDKGQQSLVDDNWMKVRQAISRR